MASSGATYRSATAHSRPPATTTEAHPSSTVGSETSAQTAGWTCEYDGPCSARILVVKGAAEREGEAAPVLAPPVAAPLFALRHAVRLTA
jgi:hypothetical protein